MKHKIAFITGSRADFGLIYSVIKHANDHELFDPIIIRVGHSLQDDVDIREIGFKIPVYSLPTQHGITALRKTAETNFAIAEIIQEITVLLETQEPDIVFLAGDRFEILASALASFYLNIPICHIFGGDKSEGGHFDDSIRHAITKLAHIHFASCEDSYSRILKMGEEPWRVIQSGSPVIDNIAEMEYHIKERPCEKPYVLLTYHPLNFIDIDYMQKELDIIFEALRYYDLSVFVTAPNNEQGSLHILHSFLAYAKNHSNVEYIGNLGWRDYIRYLKHAEFSIGNSSSNLYEAPMLNTFSINVGRRQKNRFKPNTVFNIEDCDIDKIKNSIDIILNKKEKHSLEFPYGEKDISLNILKNIDMLIRRSDLLIKKLSY